MKGLAVSGARLVLGGRPVLDGVSLAVPPGRLNALIGPNGAGKSSLLRLVLGLEPTAEGTVRFAGADLLAMPGRRRARLAALVEQTHAADTRLDALSVALLGRIPHQGVWGAGPSPHDEAVALRALAAVGMASFAQRAYHTLSGGEQQRLHIARALAQEPRLMLLDEPTNHLDIAAQIAVLELLAGLARGGMTVLVTMHDLNLAAGFFEHLFVLDRGRLVAKGPPGAVLTPELLRAVYGVEAAVLPNPMTGRPVIAYAPAAWPAAAGRNALASLENI